MYTNTSTILASALLALSFVAAAQAQELSLFESVDVPAGQVNGPIDEPRALGSGPMFTLLGTSRLGGKYKATLQTDSGDIIRVDFLGDESVPIPGHIDYRLVAVDSRQVSIRFPAASPCVAAQDKGVQCDADGLARLSLRTAAPVVVAPTQTAQLAGEEVAQPQNENPFAAALRAASENEAAANGRGRNATRERFEVRRIPPEEVPPGMRVVRTPFGDRLVEL